MDLRERYIRKHIHKWRVDEPLDRDGEVGVIVVRACVDCGVRHKSWIPVGQVAALPAECLPYADTNWVPAEPKLKKKGYAYP